MLPRALTVLLVSTALGGCAAGSLSFPNATPGKPLEVPAWEYRPEGAIGDELTLGSGGIEKLVRRAVSTYRKDQRDEEREALLEELREVEAIGDTRSTEFRRKKKDEEPDE